ncbi:beta-ketoacyl-ACP synthase III [Streptomyces sp. WM6386]|uniref:beta-ketoacyl-ACP synthase III n=1 Tax=Streptomyces sp. WM6386 TaxID=1415558 RepID=UPI000619377E|nr:beta-ketoacyl-ACP synthase III [Streptomyces sp. WM6386]KKD03479.1 3-oxoacyl-ACP synthase [Streptomyces sp. WM6386]
MSSPPAAGRAAVLSGLGTCLPSRVVTNDDLARHLDTSHEWIHSRTGIARRRVAAPHTGTAELAAAAGRAALASAGRTGCDLVLVATTTPDRTCPATAPRVASLLDLSGTAAFDLSAVCSGFVYALAVASSLITAGTCESALVIGAERYSTITDPDDRSTAILFGDGAGAVLLERGTAARDGAVLHTDLGSDGTGEELITVPPGERYLRMRGREVYARAVPAMVDSTRRVAKAVGWEPGEIEGLIGHQANIRILQAVARRLELPAERLVAHLEDVGNTAAASIPLAMAHAAEERRLAPGARTVLTAFGGGLTWGSAALTWADVTPVHHLEPDAAG